MAHDAWKTKHWAIKPKDDTDFKAMKDAQFVKDKDFGE